MSDNEREGGFVMVPNIFINDWLPRLSPAAVVVWLFGWRESFDPKQPGWTTNVVALPLTTIMTATGLSNKTVIRALRELQENRLLERAGAVKKKAQYRWKIYTGGESTSVKKVHRIGGESTPISVENLHRPYKVLKKEKKKRNIRSSGDEQVSNGYSPDYLDWYSDYPRKIAKAAGFKAYRRQATKVADRTLLDRNTPPWIEHLQSRESQFIPYPASFLNSRVWEEPPPPTTGPRVRSGADEILEAMRRG